ncbi:MAG: GatB/YqeY domain-containing protein [Clostridia bacterium]|nr:GatB/YqeY domain-containing protein [[Bacteroides] pectinophilus]MDD5872011.1 GatB/YqeY domain-containing protein [Clostridia bacterium]
MNKIDFIRGEMVAAMKAKDKARKDVLSLLLAELKNFEINNRKELTDEDGDQIILKQIKQLKETLSMTPADRQDIIDECNFSISVLSEYAPKMMDEAEIKKVIDETLAELSIEKPTAKDKGAIMRVLMPKVKGKADGKLVNEVLAGYMA